MVKEKNGFTLVEMLIVLMIISILILLIVPHVSKKSANIHHKGCDALVELVQSQKIAYELDKKKPLTKLSQLVGEYIEEKHLKCGNGKEIKLKENGEVYYE